MQTIPAEEFIRRPCNVFKYGSSFFSEASRVVTGKERQTLGLEKSSNAHMTAE